MRTLYPPGMELIKKHLPKQGKLALDLGANNGKWTRPLSLHFERVIALEPDPRAWKINHSQLPSNCQLIQAAIGNEKGISSYSLMPYSMNSTLHIKDGAKEIIEIEVMILDDFINEPIDFIKMDIEGYEVKVLKSAENFLRKLRPILVVEPHKNKKKILEIMSQYEFYEVHIYDPCPPAQGQIVFVEKK